MDRSKITFAQAEGAVEMPKQLELKQLDKKAKALIWASVYRSYQQSIRLGINNTYLDGPWVGMLKDFWVDKDGDLDKWPYKPDHWRGELSRIFHHPLYAVVLSGLEFFLRHKECPNPFLIEATTALERAHAAYRVMAINGIPCIVPVGTEAEAGALGLALKDIASHGPNNAASHLADAIERLNGGDFSGAIRESIHAVECAACKVAGDEKASLGKALSALKKKDINLHKSLEQGLNKIYGYTSDEKGIRHALAFDEKEGAVVDEADALFMFGACASFVSYLLRKGRAAGLIDE